MSGCLNRPLRFLAVAGLILGWANEAPADFIFSAGLADSSVKPADFQNSTILSVAVSPSGQVVASRGFNLATVPFDGSPSTSIDLPFTSSGVVVQGMRFNSAGELHLLMLNFSGPGSVRRAQGGDFPVLVEFAATQQFSREMAIYPNGDLLVAGTFGSVGEPGWLLKFDSSGSKLFDVNIPQSQSPAGLASTSAGQAYLATLAGQIYSVSGSGALNLVTSLPSGWIGGGLGGNVESFAISNDNHFFLGLNLGQRFGTNSSAILRLSQTGQANAIALGVGDTPIDMTFDQQNNLYIASHGITPSGSQVFKVSGDFSGDLAVIPEPSGLALVSTGILCLAGCVWRRRKKVAPLPVYQAGPVGRGCFPFFRHMSSN